MIIIYKTAVLISMKFGTISNFFLGIYPFLGVYISDIKAEVSVQPYPSTRTKHVGDDLSPASSIKSLGLEPKIFKRAQKWTTEEEELLLELRSQELSWNEIKKYFPERSWNALTLRYSKLTRDPSTSRKKPKPFTPEESKLLLELSKTNTTWRERAKYFPGRKANAVKNHYYNLVRGYPAPKTFRRQWTAEEDKLLIELGEEGVPWEERVKFFDNRTLRSLKRQFRKLRSTNPEQKGGFTTREDDLLIEALNAGKEIEEITQLLERSEQGVKRRIRKLRKSGRLDLVVSQIGTRPRYIVADFTLMEELAKKGVSWKDIAADYFPDRESKGVKEAYMRYQERKQRGEGKDADADADTST